MSVDELADALQSSLGPFGIQVGRVASQQTDALFGQLDHDQDGKLSPAELESAKTMLSKLDLDEDEQIGRDELEPFSDPMIPQADDDPTRRGRYAGVPPIVELTPEDPSFRPVRLLLKKYDKPARPARRPATTCSAAPSWVSTRSSFATADADSDGLLDTEELRRWLARVAPELEVRVKLPGNGSENDSDGGDRLHRGDRTGGQTLAGDRPGSAPLAQRHRYRAGRDPPRAPRRSPAIARSRKPGKSSQNQFKEADANANNYVEKAEAAKATVGTGRTVRADRHRRRWQALSQGARRLPRSPGGLGTQPDDARDRRSRPGHLCDPRPQPRRTARTARNPQRRDPGDVLGPEPRRPDQRRRDPPSLPVHTRPRPGGAAGCRLFPQSRSRYGPRHRERGRWALPGSARWTTTATATSPAASSSGQSSAFERLDRDHDGLIDATEAAAAK